MSNDFEDLFDDDGELDMPTMRGSANLDVEDYERTDGGDATIFGDEIGEDIPSTPGRNPGAAAATDVEGTSSFELLDVDEEQPGIEQTTYGSHPWPPGSGAGYRPYSAQRTDMELRALNGGDDMPAPRPPHHDAMHLEPEVINASGAKRVRPPKWHGNRNQMPSNAEVDLMTIYDRTSYERSDSTQNVIGSGVFDTEEGVTWRERDGIFSHQYAFPAYIGEEDELDVQQSQMWDTVADEWRVVQPSGGGVTFSRDVNALKPEAYSPFIDRKARRERLAKDRINAGKPAPVRSSLRPEATGPRSHIEAFGRDAARCVVAEARMHTGADRDRFLAMATESLGPQMSAQCRRVADQLIALGYRADLALEDAIAHCVMHAAVSDLTAKGRTSTVLPRLDRLAKKLTKSNGTLRDSAKAHIAPLATRPQTLQGDLQRLYASPSVRGLGAFGTNGEAPAGDNTLKIALAVGAVGLGGWLLWSNRKPIMKNARKLRRKVLGS
jgi:hypothetical protein